MTVDLIEAMVDLSEADAERCKRWFSGQPRLVVWDFDLTILNCHAFGEGVEVAQVAGRWQADVRDADLFRAFVDTAQALGVSVGIASYGRREVIAEYMDQIFAGRDPVPFSVVTNIVTPAALGLPDGTSVPSGKSQMLKLLCERLSPAIEDPSAVLFFDDDGENVRDCQRAGFRHAIHTPDGFSKAALISLEAAGHSSSTCAVS